MNQTRIAVLTLACAQLLLVLLPLASAVPLRAILVRQIPFAQPPPFTWVETQHQRYYGPMGTYLERALMRCNVTDGFVAVGWNDTSRQAENAMLNLPGLDIAFPIAQRQSFDRDGTQQLFVPMITSPGTMILKINDWKPTDLIDAVFNQDIMSTLLALLCFVTIFGVLIWLADRSHRKSNFPMQFIDGVGVGMWWAMVTCVTVGYGDRVPKTKTSRIIAAVWMLFGLIISALLTGYVVGELTTSSSDILLTSIKDSIDNLYGLKIGVLPQSVEEVRVRARGAIVVPLSSIQSGIDLLESGAVDSLAVDMLAAGVISRMLGPNSRIQPSVSIEVESVYGYLLSNATRQIKTNMPFANVPSPGTLGQCLHLLAAVGLDDMDMLFYAREYVDMSFEGNYDLHEIELEKETLAKSQSNAMVVLPLLALVVLTLGYLAGKYFEDAVRHTALVNEPAATAFPMSPLSTSNAPAPFTVADKPGGTRNTDYPDRPQFPAVRRPSDMEEARGGERPDGTITRLKLEQLQAMAARTAPLPEENAGEENDNFHHGDPEPNEADEEIEEEKKQAELKRRSTRTSLQ